MLINDSSAFLCGVLLAVRVCFVGIFTPFNGRVTLVEIDLSRTYNK